MANRLRLKDAAKARDSITRKQAIEIRNLYRKAAKELQKEVQRLKYKNNVSSILQQQRIAELQKQLDKQIEEIGKEIENSIRTGILEISSNVCNSAADMGKELGFVLTAGYSSVPNQIIRKIVTGQIYDTGWSLSNRIWDITKATQKEIYKVVAAGMAENKGAYEIAKDLEEFVNPDKRKPWNLKMKDGKRIYKKMVDYNAQRLARTLAQHAYQQSVVEVTKNNPWVQDYIWHANGSRVCPICRERDGRHYKVNEIPLDHPNGMCVIEPVFQSSDKVIDDLANWVNSDIGTYPEIDKYASELTGVDVKKLEVDKIYGKNRKYFEKTIDNIGDMVYNRIIR